MKRLFYLFIIFLIFSCNKKDDLSNDPASMLMQGSWYLYKTDNVIFIDANNQLESDTSYIAEDCIQQSSFQFLKDSVFERSMHCYFAEPNLIKGKWYFTEDSLLVSNYLYTLPPGSGYQFVNFGFGTCKLLDISPSQFTMRSTEWFYDLNSTKYRNETTYLCKRK